MSSWDLMLGYTLSLETFQKCFEKPGKKATFHYEDRYDSKTGVKLAKKVKVIDTSATERSLTYNGQNYGDEICVLVEDLTGDLKCSYRIHDEGEFITLGEAACCESVKPAWVADSVRQQQLSQLADKIKTLGLAPGPLLLTVCFD